MHMRKAGLSHDPVQPCRAGEIQKIKFLWPVCSRQRHLQGSAYGNSREIEFLGTVYVFGFVFLLPCSVAPGQRWPMYFAGKGFGAFGAVD